MLQHLFANAGLTENGNFGAVQREHVEQLIKALSAGSDVNNPGTSAGQGFPLRVESLEAQMKNLSFSMDEIKLFRGLEKVPASNTVEEFNRLISYDTGGQDSFIGGFIGEGDLPDEEDSTYERATVLMKFLGQTRRVTHVMDTIKSAHGDVIAQQTNDGTMSLLKILENALFFGDADLVSVQFDGLLKQITANAPSNVIDLRGAAPNEDVINDALEMIRRNNGMATDLYFGTGPFSDLAKIVQDRMRFPAGAGQGDTLGMQVRYFQGQHGKVNFHDHLFIPVGGLARAAGLGKVEKRPLEPTLTVAPANNADASSLLASGTYIYKVVAGNRYGLSTPLTTASATTTAPENVTFTISDSGRATYYEIYRTAAGAAASTARLMTRVKRTGATQVFTDRDFDMPGLSNGFLLQQNKASMSWAQLLGMTRVPLATVDTSIRWAQVCYGALKLYAPGKNIVFKNVGRAPGSTTNA
jgi:hypothetical protein